MGRVEHGKIINAHEVEFLIEASPEITYMKPNRQSMIHRSQRRWIRSQRTKIWLRSVVNKATISSYDSSELILRVPYGEATLSSPMSGSHYFVRNSMIVGEGT